MYPTSMTVSSPKETERTEIQNGSQSNQLSSKATMNPLKRTGMKIANNKCLENIITIPARTVAIVPNKRSQAENENRFAIKQPMVKPIKESFLKKQRSINNSATLNCKAKNEIL